MKPKHTILWADDDIDDREMFREVLEAHAPDHEVVEFSNGKELLSYLKCQNVETYPCLIVLDLNMPVLGGRKTFAEIKADPLYKQIPVVVFTTSIIQEDKKYFERFRVTTLTKPPTYPQLKVAIERLVDLCQMADVD